MSNVSGKVWLMTSIFFLFQNLQQIKVEIVFTYQLIIHFLDSEKVNKNIFSFHFFMNKNNFPRFNIY